MFPLWSEPSAHLPLRDCNPVTLHAKMTMPDYKKIVDFKVFNPDYSHLFLNSRNAQIAFEAKPQLKLFSF